MGLVHLMTYVGYGWQMNEKKWLRRIIFLETVAGVPGAPVVCTVSSLSDRFCVAQESSAAWAFNPAATMWRAQQISARALRSSPLGVRNDGSTLLAGMVGGMLRHMRSLRTMKRDHGRIHTLLEEVCLSDFHAVDGGSVSRAWTARQTIITSLIPCLSHLLEH